MLKLLYASTSAYVRKVMVTAHQLGLQDCIELLPSAAHPLQRDRRIARVNPLAKVPALQAANGQFLYDSRVICEYLNALAQGSLYPTSGDRRWQSLTRQALGDGIIDAALLIRYESTTRPADKQWDGWSEAQWGKVLAALQDIEQHAATFSCIPDDIGLIALGCALGYLDFRFAERAWRQQYPHTATWFAQFDAHPAMVLTRPFA